MKSVKKNLLAAGAVLLAATALIICTDIQSVDEYYSSNTKETSDINTVTVSLTVECSTIPDSGKYDESLSTVPADGIILATAQYDIISGSTVFELMSSALKSSQVQFDYTGNGVTESVYVKGIDNIYEYDYGDLSGWMYSVNGEYPQQACSEYTLSDGDVVVWSYTCDLGRDLEETVDFAVSGMSARKYATWNGVLYEKAYDT